jgi:DNA mismatch endonuclease (patch repair protein)
MDTITKEQRSYVMSRIRSTNTAIERKVFAYLRKEGIHFQRHYKRVPGNPDIALPRMKKAIFIDGDFWHGWKFAEKKQRLPAGYWHAKIEGNILRDKARRRLLKKSGWQVLRIWEHQLKQNEQATLVRIKRFLAR